jgi:hypothetical protein
MPDKKVKIRDNRKNDMVTGKAMTDTNRMHSEVDQNLLRSLIVGAKAAKLDPYTVLAMSMQESNFDPENPMHIDFTQYKGIPEENLIGNTMDILNDKIRIAKSKGKNTEADIIQAWNGYGKFSNANDEIKGDRIYGINLLEQPNKTLDMNTSPVYGKRILDLRDNVIKTHPEIQAMVKEIYGGEPIHATSENIKEAMAKTGHADQDEFLQWFNKRKQKTIVPIN